MTKKITVFLTPCDAHFSILSEIIRELSIEHDGPIFRPHATMFYGEPKPQVNMEDRCRDLAATLAPIEVPIERLEYGLAFTRTFFIRLKPIQELLDLNVEIAKNFAPGSGYEFMPHVSLFYSSTLDEATKRHLTQNIELPFDAIKFDRLDVIAAQDSYTRREDIEAEKLLATSPFAKS